MNVLTIIVVLTALVSVVAAVIVWHALAMAVHDAIMEQPGPRGFKPFPH